MLSCNFRVKQFLQPKQRRFRTNIVFVQVSFLLPVVLNWTSLARQFFFCLHQWLYEKRIPQQLCLQTRKPRNSFKCFINSSPRLTLNFFYIFSLSFTALFWDLLNQRQGLLSKAVSSMWMHSGIIILRTQQSKRTHAFMDRHNSWILTWWCHGTFYGMLQKFDLSRSIIRPSTCLLVCLDLTLRLYNSPFADSRSKSQENQIRHSKSNQV